MPLTLYSDKKISHIIGIAAGKGGVGKSSITVNLALALQKLGFSVGVMDTDIYGPSIRRMLPEERLPAQKGEIITPALSKGIKMISMAYFRKAHESAAVRAPIANGVINQFIKQVDWGNLDFLLIDFPPGTGDIQLTLSQQASLTGALMVTTPQEISVMDVRKAIHLFEQVRIPILGIVENMSYYFERETQKKHYLFGKGGGERLALDSGVPYLGGVPIDPAICSAGDGGFSLFENAEHSETASIFLSLAEKMISQADAIQNFPQQQFELIWRDM